MKNINDCLEMYKLINKNKEKIINNRVISKISIIFLLNSSFDNYLKLLTY